MENRDFYSSEIKIFEAKLNWQSFGEKLYWDGDASKLLQAQHNKSNKRINIKHPGQKRLQQPRDWDW